MPLTHICNLSFQKGVFPTELKIANVVPIYKSGDEMIFTNYRPVSVLPVFSKLLERLMYNRLIGFINANNLLYEYQFGFQKGKSTHMALIFLIDKITEALDQGNCVIGIFIDFSKAFDTVDHKLLLQKMKLYGIQGTANQWFHDYLSNRYQYVTYNGVKSKQEIITCGVPQGSLLGPLLFLLYVNDLYLVTKASLPVLFADDTNIFITGKNSKEMCDKINEDLENIREWLCCNKLSLNILKTHYMVFTPRNKVVNDIDICINDVRIERVYVTKFLGIQIDSQLNWKKHIDYICKKLSKCVGIIAKARKKLYKSSLITLYYSFAYPYFIYCNHVWGNTFKTSLEKMVLVQKKLIRIITCSPYRAHTGPLLFANRIMTLSDINVYMTGIFMYQWAHKNIPNIFQNFFHTNRAFHSHDTRHANDLCVPNHRIEIRKCSMKVHGVQVWNDIPDEIKASSSIDMFKRKFRSFLIDRWLTILV